MEIIGAKGGSSGSSDKGENRGTEIASVAYMKILLALTEGEAAGGFTGKDIYLDGTPLLDDSGNKNFPGVTWEWRSGTVDQEYISGFPAVENEVSVSTELKYGTPWVKSITNTQLSAVRLRIKFPNGLYAMRDSGGKNGYSVEYAVDISTDGSTYTEYGRDKASGIANTGYERSYRIDLPPAQTGWQIRVRRLTSNSTDGRHADTTRIESITDIVDAKLRYPNTSLLFVQFDSQLFDGRTPTVTVKMKGVIVRIPSNYDPINRTYNGTWDGTFKWAWTNNPAWIFYDIVTRVRFGLGRRISASQVDKWTLYKIAQYCDEEVSDGVGGKEARYLCDLYITQRTDAWTVLMDLVAIFRGMISWSNNLLSVDADMPRELDPDFVFSKSNIIGSFNFSSTSERTNYSAAIVTYSNPANGYNDDQASVHVQEVSSRFGFNTMEMTAVGCTRESEAQRRGLWAIETNRDDNAVEFKTGFEGRIPRVGKVIGVNNAPLAGRANGGRVTAADGTKITLDRKTAAVAGDNLIINLPTGKAEGRLIKSVSGRAVTVVSAYSTLPDTESGWVIDQQDLAIQLFRVRRVAIGSDDQVTISGLPYNPNKFPKIDDGAIVEDRPVTVVPPSSQPMPTNIEITSEYRVDQGIGINTMVVSWDPAANAVAYEVQWRQNSGDWINANRTGNTRMEVDGIYAGRYIVRVRAINAMDIASMWAVSKEVQLDGKTGKPPVPVNLRATGLLWGIRIDWAIPTGAEDSLCTEVQYALQQDADAALLLSNVTYPQSTYTQTGLRAGQEFWYRARIIDRIGNPSDWTDFVRGVSSAVTGDVLGDLVDGLMTSEDGQRLTESVEGSLEASWQNALAGGSILHSQFAQLGPVRAEILQVATTVAKVDEAMAELGTDLKAQVATNTAAISDKLTAMVDSDGASAIHTLRVGVKFNGQEINAGMSIAAIAQPGKPPVARVAFNAEEFVLLSGSGDKLFSPFAAKGGQVFIQDGVFEEASINFGKISDTLKSTNFVSGENGAGWNLPKSGDAELNNVTIRGKVYATDGEFTGKINATDGTFKGTVQAEKFIGDIANMNVWPDFLGSGNRTITRYMNYTDSTQEAVTRNVCVMFTGRTAGGVTITINGNSKSYTGASTFTTYMHAISTTSATINASISLSTTDAAQGIIYSPTMIVARGSGSFS
ncbi:host specificity protein J [Kluyvera sichuanensis]|uniref:host specificity protein J n=1 Tax=Kluyvera sichuanensis TaxID=2725494 RepID=UPI0034A341C2